MTTNRELVSIDTTGRDQENPMTVPSYVGGTRSMRIRYSLGYRSRDVTPRWRRWHGLMECANALATAIADDVADGRTPHPEDVALYVRVRARAESAIPNRSE